MDPEDEYISGSANEKANFQNPVEGKHEEVSRRQIRRMITNRR
jgi:hypothetical protein